MNTPNPPNAAERPVELPDDIRVPLDALWADAEYSYGRVAADGTTAGMFASALRKKIEAAKMAIRRELDSHRHAESVSAEPVAPAKNDLRILDDPDAQEKFSATIMGAMAFGAENVRKPPEGHWLNQWWDLGRLHAAPPAQAVSVPEGAFLIIGYGESDIPDARYATTPEEIRAAFAALVFGDPKACGEEADSEIEDLVEGFNNPDEWSGDGRWSVTFEIGGINAYRLATPAAATREGKE